MKQNGSKQWEWHPDENWLNRMAVVIKRREPFMTWGKRIAEGRTEPRDIGNTYLIPDLEFGDDADQFVRDNYTVFFETECMDWAEDRSLLPDDMSWEKFEEWFEVVVSWTVLDMSDEPLEVYDDLLPE